MKFLISLKKTYVDVFLDPLLNSGNLQSFYTFERKKINISSNCCLKLAENT